MLRLTMGRRIKLATMTAVCALAGAAAAQDMPSVATPPAPHAAAPAPETSGAAATQPTAAAAQATAPQPGPAAPAAHPLNKGQLAQLVAPIALYPDPLLSQVLMASTYPLEIVEAERWVRQPADRGLKGDALTQALKAQNWDPSVMALVPFPKLLALMAEKLQWTEALGNAFLAQQTDVMAAVQTLRHEAMVAGNLKATPQCHCVIQTSGDVISILPSETDQVCIPVYNPRVAYGTWSEPDYPPYFFPIPAGYVFEPGYEIGYYPLVDLAFFGPLWGWGSFDWGRGDIVVDRSRFDAIGGRGSFSGNTWVHDPGHRGGVAYSDPAVTSRFGAARTAAVAAGGRAALSPGAPAGAAAGRFGAGTAAGRFGAGASAGHFGRAAASGAAAAGRFGAGAGAAHFGGGRFAGSGHFGGGGGHQAAFAGHGPVGRGPGPVHGGGGGHIAHAQFSGGGGGAHFGGGGGAHFGGGGGGHGGGGGSGRGGGGGGHGGGGHH